MMNDFNVLEFIQLIPVTSVDMLDMSTLRIKSTDVRPATRVVINSVDTPEFVILSATELVATIPASQVGNAIETITVVGKSNQISTVAFTAKSPHKMTDSTYVLQKFMRLLLMDPGSDIFNPEMGAGLQNAVGSEGVEDIELLTVTAIQKAEQQLKNAQYPELPDSKSLMLVEIQNVSYSINTLTVSITISLTMADGTKVDTDFSVLGY